MDRLTFEALRDLPGKVVRGDLRLSRRQALAPLLTAEGIRIENTAGVELIMNIQFNPAVGSKTVNVHVPGVGPICRLDVDGPVHRPAGRTHKHSLQTAQCPDSNLPAGVIDRPDLAGQSLLQVFAAFCQMANIHHDGHFEAP